jgi:hypothetical protein
MAHLSKLPTIFVKDGDRREAYYTVQARELLEQGYVVEDGEPVGVLEFSGTKEVVPEVGMDVFDIDTPEAGEEIKEEPAMEEPAEEVAEEEKPKRVYRRKGKSEA